MSTRWAGFAAALLVLALAGPALAEPSVRIREADPTPGRLQVVLAGSDLEGRSLDSGSVQVSLDGMQVPSTAEPLQGEQAAIERKVVLVIDTSGSMQGAGIEGARQAAASFLSSVPADVQVGLVTFADVATLAVPVTLDRSAITATVNGLTAAGETALDDGVSVAVQALGAGGVRSLIVLSDGGDTSSTGTFEQASAAVVAAEARLDAVAFRTDESAEAVLQQYAAAAGGSVLQTADGTELAAAFRSAAQELASQLLVTVEVPDELAASQAQLRIEVSSGDRLLSDEIVTLLPAAAPEDAESANQVAGPRPVVVADGWLGSPASLNVALVGLFLAMVVLLSVALGSVSRRNRSGVRTRRLLSLYTLAGRPAKVSRESTALGDSDVARSAVELAGRLAQRRGVDERVALKLDRAAVPLKPGEWLLVCVGAAVAGFVLLLLLTGSGLTALVVGALAALLPGAWLSFKAGRRRAAFLDAMPDSLQLLAGSLSAGFSLPQAIDAVAREGAEPLAGEFGRAVAESRLGVPIEDALDSIADRMDSEDFRWVVMAVRVQREVGGNLAEVLGTVAQTMRDRASLRRQVRALSAEGRLSAYVLIGLPIGMTAYLFLFRRSYLEPLYTQVLGIVMIVVALLLLVVGSFWMKKVVTVEV